MYLALAVRRTSVGQGLLSDAEFDELRGLLHTGVRVFTLVPTAALRTAVAMFGRTPESEGLLEAQKFQTLSPYLLTPQFRPPYIVLLTLSLCIQSPPSAPCYTWPVSHMGGWCSKHRGSHPVIARSFAWTAATVNSTLSRRPPAHRCSNYSVDGEHRTCSTRGVQGRPRPTPLSECTPAIRSAYVAVVAEVPWPVVAEGLKVLPPVVPSRRMSWLHRYHVVVLDLCSHSVAKIVVTDGHRRREAVRRERA